MSLIQGPFFLNILLQAILSKQDTRYAFSIVEVIKDILTKLTCFIVHLYKHVLRKTSLEDDYFSFTLTDCQ